MGVDVQFGRQKYWTYGATYDGTYKETTASGRFKFSQNLDFLYPDDKQVAATIISGATVTANASLTMHPTTTIIGSSSLSVVRRLGGAEVNYGQSRFYLYGQPTPGLYKKDFGQQTYSSFGSVDGDLFPSTQGAILSGSSRVSANIGIRFNVNSTMAGNSVLQVLRRIGGATDPQGNQKHWSAGQAMGLTFFALGNTVNTTNIQMFANQTLWYYGLPTPDMIGTVSTPVVVTSVAKIISARMMTKRQSSGWPSATKIIGPSIPTKRSAST